MSLSLGNGETPVAVIKGSENNDGKILYLNSYDGALTDITLMDGSFSQLPHPEYRTALYCFGSPGAGKSTYVAKFVKNWLAMMKPKILQHKRRDFDPDESPGQVFMLSEKEEGEDKAFDGMPIKFMKIDESLLEDPLSYKDFPPGSMVIFDDISAIKPNKLAIAIRELLENCLKVGRARGINVCCTNHLGADHKATKTILDSSTHIVFFPRSSSPKQIKYVLETYGGLDKDQIKQCFKTPSPWLCLFRNQTPMILYNTGSFILNPMNR
jgi:hypothetical protein